MNAPLPWGCALNPSQPANVRRPLVDERLDLLLVAVELRDDAVLPSQRVVRARSTLQRHDGVARAAAAA